MVKNIVLKEPNPSPLRQKEDPWRDPSKTYSHFILVICKKLNKVSNVRCEMRKKHTWPVVVFLEINTKIYILLKILYVLLCKTLKTKNITRYKNKYLKLSEKK